MGINDAKIFIKPGIVTDLNTNYISCGRNTNIMDTIDRLNKVGMVANLDVLMSSPSENSSVMMNVDVDKEHRESLFNVLDEICLEKKLLSVKSLD